MPLVMVGTAACSVGIACPPVNKANQKEAGWEFLYEVF